MSYCGAQVSAPFREYFSRNIKELQERAKFIRVSDNQIVFYHFGRNG